MVYQKVFTLLDFCIVHLWPIYSKFYDSFFILKYDFIRISVCLAIADYCLGHMAKYYHCLFSNLR